MGVSICLDVVSIKTLDLDTAKKSVSTVEKNLDTEKKLVLTIEIFRSRLRNLNFVSTPPSSTKSLDQDRERTSCQDFLSWSTSKMIMLWYLDKSWKVLTNLKNLDSLNLTWQSRKKSRRSQVSIEKSQPRKNKSWSWRDG
jgi:hypothetical protein